MPKTKTELRILYLQIRKDQETRNEEFNEFVRFSGLSPEQFTVLNVFDTPQFEPTLLDAHDALFIGGSSDDPDHTVEMPEDLYPYIRDTRRLIRYVADNSIPTFASCMGFQIAVDELGGELMVDKEHTEMGSYPIYVEDGLENDPLFAAMPKTFLAISGHKKRAKRLPPGSIQLAHSDLCPIHGFKLKDKPFYAFQFHPEIDRADLVARIIRYKNRGYLKGDVEAELMKLTRECQETPESNTLPRLFVERVLLGNTAQPTPAAPAQEQQH